MFIPSLRKRLSAELPGRAAQLRMAHMARLDTITVPENPKKASVMILLYDKNEEWHTVLMRRTSRFKNDKHKGQVSFPGGQAEPTDINKAATALRETEEEMGLPVSSMNVLGALSPLYIPVSNFLVQPYVGYTALTPNFAPDNNEVESIIETPLSALLAKENLKKTDLIIPEGFKLNNVPYFDVGGNVVWGATSMIISEFIQILDEVDYHLFS
ncbi:MAG: 8-oxo-dGTP pyrophosphatase MutT (NUDIX family) [Maribacter sp.]|jgi:8-oxo-dGTP pyrophosphatase MutT (NUDIX family)